MTQSLPPDTQVSIAFGDILMSVNEKETGVAHVTIEENKYAVFTITTQMEGNG